MSFSTMRSSVTPFRSLAAAAIVFGLLALPLWADNVYAADRTREAMTVQSFDSPQQGENENADPESNLPYLFAAFTVVWAGFFTFVFITSRRQRGMRRDIETLRMALAERERQEETLAGRSSAHEDALSREGNDIPVE